MRRVRRRSVDIFNLSFLDVVSCGFGAIILLLVIVKISEPAVLEKLSYDLSGLVTQREQELHQLRGEVTTLEQELAEQRQRLADSKARLARLRGDLVRVRGRYATLRSDKKARQIVQARLESARQQLSEEMRRLLGPGYSRPVSDAAIGGVPVDSEYIIFIIDTSGSMRQNAWPLVLKKLAEILDIYPTVKGIQVLNDMGDYMFSQYRGRWIPDSPARRRAVVKRLAGWEPFSNSSPVEGIEAAIRRYYAEDKRISLYVFGDDFSRGSIQPVIDTVARLNRKDRAGARRVRIHAVGFPVQFSQTGFKSNAIRFAALMRKLAEDNGGSFVGLNTLRP